MKHLTEPELYDLLEVNLTSSIQPKAAAHVATCAQCRAELNTLRTSFSIFKESAAAYAMQHTPAVRMTSRTELRKPFLSLRPALATLSAAAALVIAGALGMSSLHHHATPPKTPAAAVEPNTSDEALLQSISDDIDQPVPVSLRILAGPSQSQSTTQAHPERTN